VPFPKPATLRLVDGDARLTPPCGVASWSLAEDADLVVVASGASLDLVAARLPRPETLRPGTLVLLIGAASAGGGRGGGTAGGLGSFLGRWGRATTARSPRALRTSALLAAGYERLGGGVDPTSGHDLAWGYAKRLPADGA
jgi:hypothetical protein